eukprot:TRINITY_DN13763_c0_g1_i2.p1 TRINITY_DN13763_c0_g1~~TRINITY_DN13763_c0_g1_i2.p1  ORF type:complete len:369 (-),score=153.56 TRINITY_DN13763_c0_g1_i2:251-1357(-)
MVAQKRAASRQPAGAGAKAAKKGDRFTEDCAAVLSLLERSESGLNDVTRQMIQKALPHALRTAGAERHAFQSKLVDSMAGVFKSVEARAKSSADEAKAKVEEASSALGAATEAEQAASSEASEKQTARDGRDASLKEATTSASTASSSLDDVRVQEGSLKGDHDKAVGAHGEHEAFLTEAWAPLKAGNWPGKQWRERNKVIEKLAAVMETLKMEESLRKSVPFALKAKVEERGAFAASCVDFVEGELNEHLGGLKKEIDGHDDKVAEVRKAVEEAEAALKAAEETREGRATELMDAENALGQAKQSQAEAKQATEAAKKTERSLGDALEVAKADLASVAELLGKFEALCEHGLAVSAAAEEAAVAAGA